MKKIAPLFLVALVIVLSGCTVSNPFVKKPIQTACTMEAKLCSDGSAVGRQGPNCEFAECPLATSTADLANPASVNCKDKGGNLVMKTRGDGGQYGLCYFEDNRACEEWSLMRGDCPLGGMKTTGYDTEEQMYCAWLGGSTVAAPNANCTFKDGSVCPNDKLFKGTCNKGDISKITIDDLKQAFADKYKKKINEIEVTVSQKTDNFVRGGVTIGEPGPGAGGYFLAAKINGIWKIVIDGNGQISCKLVNSYGFPKEMISDCSDN